ncbi:MAG: YhgE/Pip domain-containing protein [Eggerthellales bacterium]|nr:YhgE/Pip domain-containing protein [Eggerthellales bacterium]
MKNVLAVLKRDFIRLVKAPAALVVVVALLILPSLYTWYNVLGFWNPYDNTGNMRVAVVNEDQGGSHELTGQLNVGDKIIEALGENHQLNWQFEDRDTAMRELESGKNYAVFVIPGNFTGNLLTLLSGNFQQPNIQYYVNMKTGPVAPKITDAGSTALEETVNSTFIATVSDVAFEALSAAIEDAEDAVSQGSSRASAEVEGAIGLISQVRSELGSVDGALAYAQTQRGAALAALDEARSALSDVEGDLGDVSAKVQAVQQALIDATPEAMDAVQRALTALYALEGSAQAGGYEDQLHAAIEALETCSQVFFGTMMPAVTNGLGSLSATSAQLQAAASQQQAVIDQAQTVLEQLDGALSTARQAVGQTDGLLATAVADLRSLQVSLTSLASSSALSSLVESGTLDSQAIADFMGSPTTVVTEKLFEPNVYGSAMAPLFMNLTFWIGAFMLLVIMRQEVDAEGIKNLKVSQRYLARFIMFSLFAIIQACVCCAGLLWLGVEVASPVALFVAASVASLAYLSIIYALSVLFQHIGKGLCIILVFMQIPSATGLYPIEMMAGFYQAISPFFPFTYGISALREAICGFYGSTFVKDLCVLAVFFVTFLALGVFLRPYLANVNRTFAMQLEASGIYNSEAIEVPERRFRLSQLTRALSDQHEYRVVMVRRYEQFKRVYPHLIKGAMVAGVAIPLGMVIALGMNVGEKVTLLSIWLAFVFIMLLFLTVVESLREGFERQISLGDMSENDLHKMYAAREYMEEPEEQEPVAAPVLAGSTFVNVEGCMNGLFGLNSGYELVECEGSAYKQLVCAPGVSPWMEGGQHHA